MNNDLALPQLGWLPFFQQQLSLEELEKTTPARIVNYERSVFTVLTATGKLSIAITSSMPPMTVGDWLLLDTEKKFHRLLERSSEFSRKSETTKASKQLIAANIDTVFVVCSLNLDFSLSRIERYLALAHEAQVEPVAVLTKIDLCDNVQDYVTQVQALDPALSVVAVDSLDPISVGEVEPWCGEGQTVALLGSSGVGKSSLVNTLMGENIQRTSAIREEDSRGRHTTSSRSLHLLPNGGLLLDTPGIRELQLAESEQSVGNTFSDIADLAMGCKFSDCQHVNEPGCAVLKAIASGELDARRLANFHKLLHEEAMSTAALAEKRARGKKSARLYRSGQVPDDRKRTD